MNIENIFCPKCGSKQQGNAFCSKCGNQLIVEEQKKDSDVKESQIKQKTESFDTRRPVKEKKSDILENNEPAEITDLDNEIEVADRSFLINCLYSIRNFISLYIFLSIINYYTFIFGNGLEPKNNSILLWGLIFISIILGFGISNKKKTKP